MSARFMQSVGAAWLMTSLSSSPFQIALIQAASTLPFFILALPAGSIKFDAFVHEFNNERPHEALDMKCPGEVYKASTRQYRGIAELSYPFHDRTALVTYCGRICIFKKKINLSTSLAGQAVGIKEVDEGIGWSALWTMISVTSILRRRLCNP